LFSADAADTGLRSGRKFGVKVGRLTMQHVYDYEKEVSALNIPKKKIAPIILPDYIPDHVKVKQKTTEYFGTLF
jgi:hypothetical protein